MDCPKCNHTEKTRDGIVRGKQRYKCKSCNYRYTVERKSDVKTKEVKRLALEMYLEGLGFRSIGRILKISHVTVYYWVKYWSDKVNLPKKEDPVEIVKLDQMHSYVGNKKTTARYGLLLIDLVNGLSILSAETGQQRQG